MTSMSQWRRLCDSEMPQLDRWASWHLGFTVGYVIWVLRSGLLLSSVLSLMPAWTFFDPLAVAWTEGDEDDAPESDESLEELVESASQKVSEAELIGAVS